MARLKIEDLPVMEDLSATESKANCGGSKALVVGFLPGHSFYTGIHHTDGNEDLVDKQIVDPEVSGL